MRIRYKHYARPELAAWSQYIDKPEECAGKWKDVFKNDAAPIYLELGCGKGTFIAKQALNNPDINYIGIDLKSEVLVVAKRNIEKLFSEGECFPSNVVIMSQDIEKISRIFNDKDVIDRIYINFCNPWSKSGHAKHRLTHPRQLIQYRDFLKENSEIWFKTDDSELYVDSLRYFEYSGFNITWSTENLHMSEPDWNIRTEHENMFAEQGIPIKACIAQMNNVVLDKSEFSRLKNI